MQFEPQNTLVELQTRLAAPFPILNLVLLDVLLYLRGHWHVEKLALALGLKYRLAFALQFCFDLDRCLKGTRRDWPAHLEYLPFRVIRLGLYFDHKLLCLLALRLSLFV